MVYVNPITGPHSGKQRFCYVCNFQSKPVVAVFVKPEALEEPGLLESIQKMWKDHSELECFVVCMSGPNKEIVTKLRALFNDKKLEIPLTVLPDDESKIAIYQSLPIRPEAKYTFLFYVGRQIDKVSEDIKILKSLSPLLSPRSMKFNRFANSSAGTTDPASNKGSLLDAALNVSPAFKELDDAAKSIIKKYR